VTFTTTDSPFGEASKPPPDEEDEDEEPACVPDDEPDDDEVEPEEEPDEELELDDDDEVPSVKDESAPPSAPCSLGPASPPPPPLALEPELLDPHAAIAAMAAHVPATTSLFMAVDHRNEGAEGGPKGKELSTAVARRNSPASARSLRPPRSRGRRKWSGSNAPGMRGHASALLRDERRLT